MAYTSTRRSAKSSAKYVYCMGQTKGYVPLNMSRLSRLQLRQTGVFLQLLLYIYLYRTCRRTPCMARPANAQTDTQIGGRTHRRADRHAEARTQMQAPYGARTLNIRACSAWVEKNLPDAAQASRCTIYIYIHVRTYISTYGTYVSLVPQVSCATDKRKTDSMRSKVAKGWLIGKKLGEIFLYFTSCSSSPQSTNVQS